MVKTLEGTIARELKNENFAKRLLPQIVAAREELERQAPLLRAAIEHMATAWSVELAARHDIRRQYRIVFAELIKIFPEDMKKVNSFFRDVGPARKPPPAAGEPGEEVEPPGGGSGATGPR